MFDKVLIANRGEIARRIARTCRERGFATVAVFSDADRGAPFVREADEAVAIGPAPSAESYLVSERLIEAARRTGAGAIHPGYGFLAENAAFAEACADAGIVFIGPTPDAIRAMGSKIAAKALMAEHGVPVIPGFDGGDQGDAGFIEAAPAVGFPLLVKASAGGGGKGMRIVRSLEALPSALAAARREAASAFGDPSLLIERYVTSPRHVEVQILGDAHGDVVHVFERECSIQRRHQKIIEETPSPALDPALREAICEAAVRAGRAIGYRSAGTVEFVLGPERDFYFLEVNTRLQVEHPVTELVTGLDLVALQLDVALGRPLPVTQEAIAQRGHAIEARLYAEDPQLDFLPQTGHLADWHLPEVAGVRVDSGVVAGSEVSIHYDPMLAKVVAWGEDRAEATRRLVLALERASIQGIRTNRRFLVDVLRHPAWSEGALTTHFIADHLAGWSSPAAPANVVRDVAVAATLIDVEARAGARELLPGLAIAFRNSPFRDPVARWELGGVERVVEVAYRAREERGGGRVFTVRVDGGAVEARVRGVRVDGGARVVAIEVDGLAREVRLVASAGRVLAHLGGHDVALTAVPRFPDTEASDEAGGCRAPMTGRVLALRVAPGERVVAGQALVVLEAMKMEHTLEAPRDAEVAEVLVELGEIVEADQELVRLVATS